MESPGPAQAQECMTATTGPLQLTSKQTLAVCATNLRAARTIRVGVAFYNAFDAREALQLEYFDLTHKSGTCSSFRPSRESITILAQVGHMNSPPEASPLALSAQVFPSKTIEGPRPLSKFNDLSPAYQGAEIV